MFQRFERIAVPQRNFFILGGKTLAASLLSLEILQTPTLSIFAGTLEHSIFFACNPMKSNVFQCSSGSFQTRYMSTFLEQENMIKRCIDGKRDWTYYRNETDRKCLISV